MELPIWMSNTIILSLESHFFVSTSKDIILKKKTTQQERGLRACLGDVVFENYGITKL
jgi:hypothetical protein